MGGDYVQQYIELHTRRDSSPTPTFPSHQHQHQNIDRYHLLLGSAQLQQ